jgi:hypothetical protein
VLVLAHRRHQLSPYVIGQWPGPLFFAIHAHDNDMAQRRNISILQSSKVEAGRRLANPPQANLNIDLVVVPQRKLVIAFDVNAREQNLPSHVVRDAQTPQKFNFGGFKITEHSRVVNPAAGVCIDKPNTGMENERRSLTRQIQCGVPLNY